MKIIIPIYIGVLLFSSAAIYGQVETGSLEKQKDSTQIMYYIVEGDTIAREMINLDEVYLMKKVKFMTEEDQRRYLILRRKTRKVYPYAKLAAERLTTMTERLKTIEKNSDKRRYTKLVQNYIEGEFSEKLKKLTHTEGQILVKLIDRQTGRTTYDLVKELRTGWRAFWYNTTASLFEISLKEEYKPFEVIEDYLIEDILERSFRDNILERQAPASPINYLDLVARWNKKRVNN
ncbi:hypothetical protein Aeqsu_2862 [Aequorivita sublithincola DSM 14238]|uniref:DUF4294 domain-containing protein n=1 Tax=Aequorivita sublithincola (strain DSM 14238 / LMG 21431 / ACAM 643 / 9-3) TaxID=746697 RepID=I3YZ86_AEQSU|nr:DUF4294 domain-containing protein [Aequorivita sublithincola]AFL82304.1 hypothetical protein Aeqsu_2862 [Aequorivita sublithincola DSM 14238]